MSSSKAINEAAAYVVEEAIAHGAASIEIDGRHADIPKGIAVLTPDERRVLDALRSIQYGSVTVEIAGGRLRLLRKGETEKLGEE